VKIPTPTGDVTLTVPKHAQSGTAVRLRGKGVKRKDQQGDLFVRFLVRLPETESEDVDKAVELLDAAQRDDVRGDLHF